MARARSAPPEAAFESILAETPRGEVAMRLYQAPGATAGAVLVGGVGGGFDSPARDLYAWLGGTLPRDGIAVVRVRFRRADDLGDAIYDTFAGVELLRGRGIGRVGLVGHSFGGAVVINAALLSPIVRTVVTLASQSYGSTVVGRLVPRSLLALHGEADTVLPPACSESIYERAAAPKELEIYPGAGHLLDEVSDEVKARVRAWLVRELAESRGAANSDDPGGGTGPR